MKVYQRISTLLASIANCEKSGNTEWKERHTDSLESIVKNHLPSGSGFDNGTKLSDDSTPEKLIFDVSYHHMNDAGMYDGWTEHKIIVTPSLQYGYDMRITGKDRNDIKEYIEECYSYDLGKELDVNDKVTPSTY